MNQYVNFVIQTLSVYSPIGLSQLINLFLLIEFICPFSCLSAVEIAVFCCKNQSQFDLNKTLCI